MFCLVPSLLFSFPSLLACLLPFFRSFCLSVFLSVFPSLFISFSLSLSLSSFPSFFIYFVVLSFCFYVFLSFLLSFFLSLSLSLLLPSFLSFLPLFTSSSATRATPPGHRVAGFTAAAALPRTPWRRGLHREPRGRSSGPTGSGAAERSAKRR